MKHRALLILAFLLSHLLLEGASLDPLTLTPPSGWVEAAATKPGQRNPRFPTVKFIPSDGRNASVLITLIPAKLAKVSDPESLGAFHRALCKPYSPPTQPATEPEVFSCPDGFGFQATFEDPSLIGRPPVKDNCKFVTVIAIAWQKKHVLTASIFTDTRHGSDYDEAAQLIRSVSLKPIQTGSGADERPQ